jgi:hypothetical protein
LAVALYGASKAFKRSVSWLWKALWEVFMLLKVALAG